MALIASAAVSICGAIPPRSTIAGLSIAGFLATKVPTVAAVGDDVTYNQCSAVVMQLINNL
jgi:hypothetical protein